MDLLFQCPTQSFTTGTGFQARLQVAAPADQHVMVKVTVHNRAAAGQPYNLVELRRGTTGGTLGSAITLSKIGIESTPSAPRTTVKPFSAQPSNDGSVLEAFTVYAGVRVSSKIVKIFANTTLTIFTSASAAPDIDIVVEGNE